MKSKLQMLLFGAALVAGASTSQAALPVPGADGSDGPLNPGGNVIIDLSQARTTAWTNAPDFPGGGVYDPDKWAVVFKYSSVLIASNRTVTFKNHPSTAPVVWRVNGDVTINGSVNLNGTWANEEIPKPGPGGFRGGAWWESAREVDGAGFGPGGGGRGQLERAVQQV